MNTYRILLTEREYADLAQLSQHNHDCGLYASLERVGSTIWGETIYDVEWFDAHAVKILSENADTGFANLKWNSSLGLKIHRFLASIEVKGVA